MVHTCPRCELRFTTDAELSDHLAIDHHAEPGQFDRFQYKSPAGRPAGTRYLVVAVAAAADDHLGEQLAELAAGGPAHFHVVVPAEPVEPAQDQDDDRGIALATYRMRHLVDALQAKGLQVEGEVGSVDPLRAAERAAQHEQADRVVVSVLGAGASGLPPHLVDVDLPKALEHRLGLPVTVVTR